MSGNRVEVLLTAKDEISGVVRGITATIATMAAGLVAAAGIKDGIMSAASAQTSMITSAGDLATLTGATFKDSLSTIKEVQSEISKIAAALPGETKGYGEIATNITAAVAEASKGNLESFKSDVTEVSKILGYLAASKGVDMTQGAMASGKFLSGGASLSEMFGSNDIFQKNTLFRKYIQEELKKIGKDEKDWQKLTAETRIAVVKRAGKKAMPQDVIDNLNGTTDALIQSIKTSLFDPNSGALGFLRSVKGLKGRSGLDTVQEYLKNLINFSEAVDKKLKSYGIDLDPMIAIGGFFDFLSDITKGLTQVVSGQGFGNLKAMWDGLATTFSIENITKYSKGFGDGLKNILDNASGKEAGKLWGEYVKYVFDAISAVVAGIDWFNLGSNLYRLISEFILSVDWGGVFVSIAKTLMTVLNGAVNLLSGWIDGNLRDLRNIISSTDWGDLFTSLGTILLDSIRSGIDLAMTYVSAGIQNALSSITNDLITAYNNSKFRKVLEQFGIKTTIPIDSNGTTTGVVNEAIKGAGKVLNGGSKIQMPTVGTPLSDSTLTPTGLAAIPNTPNGANVFNPVINVTGVANDLQQTADYVMAAIEQAYQQYQGAQLV